RHQIGPEGREPDRREPPQRHPDDDARVNVEYVQHLCNRFRVRPRPVVAIAAPAGMPVAGEIDGEGWPSERQQQRVPGVCVLPTSMEQDELGWCLAPLQGTHDLSVCHFDVGALNLRGTIPWER